MENEEILKEKEVLASTEDGTALDQTMLSRMETFEVNGKVLFPIMTLPVMSFSWQHRNRQVH